MLQRQNAPFYTVLALRARPDMRAELVGAQRPGGQGGAALSHCRFASGQEWGRMAGLGSLVSQRMMDVRQAT